MQNGTNNHQSVRIGGGRDCSLAMLGVNNGADLSFITFEDLTDILGATSIVKRRKLSLIGSYVMWGQVIDVTTMMPMITSYLNTPVHRIIIQFLWCLMYCHQTQQEEHYECMLTRSRSIWVLR
jgi:hypothetical protein